MSTSFRPLIKKYFRIQPILWALVISVLLYLPFLTIIDQIPEILLFQSSVDIPNPLIQLIGGQGNIVGKILLIVGLSFIGTSLATMLLLRTSNNGSDKESLEEESTPEEKKL